VRGLGSWSADTQMHNIEALVFGFRSVFVCALQFTGERDETD